MEQKNYRFIGIRPFETFEKDFFFERENDVNNIFKSINFRKNTLIHSKAGIGKTSVIKAGLLPQLKNNDRFQTFYFSVNNYIKDSESFILHNIYQKLDDVSPKNSYLDKIILPEDTLWYKFKRLESANDKTFVLILDQFENIFSYKEIVINKFRDELYTLLNQQVPVKLRDKINEKLTNNPQLLSPKGLKKLYEKINIKLVVSIRSDKLFKLDFFTDKIALFENEIEILPFNSLQAKDIFVKTAKYTPKYHIDDNLISKPFETTNKLLDEILKFLTKNNSQYIETYQIQIIGRELEKLSVKKNISKIDVKEISNLTDIYKDYYESIIAKITNHKQEISARKFIEDELIFEYERRKLTIYEGIATKKYNLDNKTLLFLTNNHLIRQITNKYNDIFYEISHDALITPILLSKQKRIKYEIRIEEELKKKKILEEKAKKQKEKIIRNRRLAIVFSFLFLISLFLGIFAKIQSNKAQKNKILYQSNLYASYALNIINSDPTLSLRFAQKSYNLCNKNNIALSSLLKSFYKTNIFYSVLDTLNFSFDYASINDKFYLTVNNSKKNKFVKISSFKRDSIIKIKFDKIISSASFFNANSNVLITTKINGKAYVFDTLGNELLQLNHKNFINYAEISNNDDKIIIATNDGNLKIWSINGELIKNINVPTPAVLFASFSDDDNFITVAGANNKVFVYNLQGKMLAEYEYVYEIENQSAIISSVHFSPNNKNILIVINSYTSDFYQAKIWDWKNDKIIKELKDFDAWINQAYFLDSVHIIAYSKKGKAHSVNIENNLKKDLLGHKNEIFDVYYSPKKMSLYTISKDKTIREWKIYNPNLNFENYLNKNVIKYSPNRTYIAMLDNKITVFDLLGNVIFEDELKNANDFYFSNSDDFIIVNSDSTAFIFNIKNKSSYTLKVDDNIIYSTLNANDSKLLLITNHYIYYFDLKNINNENKKQKKLIYRKNFKDFIKFAFSNLNKIFICTDKKIKIFNKKGLLLDSLNIPNVEFITSSENKNYKIIAFAKNKLFVLNKDLKLLNTLTNNTKITSADISEKANYIIFGDKLGNCTLFDVNCNEIFNFKQKGRILSVQFAPNEKSILILYQNKNFNTFIKSYLISADEIIKYIDELKLFGNIQTFSDDKINEFLEN